MRDGITMTDPMPDRTIGEKPQGFGLPRGVIIVLGIAAGVIVLAGIRSVQGILAPIFMAVVLTITVYPIRTWLLRKGAKMWLATLVLILGIYAILFGLAIAGVVGVAKLVALLPTYTSQMTNQIDKIKSAAASAGIGKAQVETALKGINPAKIIDAVTSLLGVFTGFASSFLFLIVLILFLGVDVSSFIEKRGDSPARQRVLDALQSFAWGTRKYFAVATIFGAIVAVIDYGALLIFAIPAAGLWALLAFVTNYIPNIGFIIGLVPPALLALVTGGVSKMIAVIVTYCIINFIIQSVLQPKFVGDAVGLTTTMSFLSLIVWAYVLGPVGAILAIPASLLVKAVLVDSDPDARWLQLFLGDEPLHVVKDPNRAKRHIFKRHPAQAAVSPTPAIAPAISTPLETPGA